MKNFSLRYLGLLGLALLLSGNTFAAGKVIFENFSDHFTVTARCGHSNHQTTLNNGDSLECTESGNYVWVNNTSYGPYSRHGEGCDSNQDFKFTITHFTISTSCVTDDGC